MNFTSYVQYGIESPALLPSTWTKLDFSILKQLSSHGMVSFRRFLEFPWIKILSHFDDTKMETLSERTIQVESSKE